MHKVLCYVNVATGMIETMPEDVVKSVQRHTTKLDLANGCKPYEYTIMVNDLEVTKARDAVWINVGTGEKAGIVEEVEK